MRLEYLGLIVVAAALSGAKIARPMFPNFEAAVVALADTIVRQRCMRSNGEPPAAALRQIVDYLLRAHAGMPDYLRAPVRIATLAFDSWALPTRGRPFHGLSADARSQQVLGWKASRIGPFRDLIRFYESLTIFAWYSVTPSAELGATPVAEATLAGR